MNCWKSASIAGALAVMAGVGLALPAWAQIELKLNGLHAPEHPVALTHHFFADRVEQLTNGEITVDVFDARQLGDAVESVQSLRNGTIAFVTVSTSNLSQVDPKVDMFSLPYLFKSGEHYWDYLTSERARGVREAARGQRDRGAGLDRFRGRATSSASSRSARSRISRARRSG